MPRAISDFSPIYPTEQVTLSFDFSAGLAPGGMLLSNLSPPSPVVSVVLVSGTDATPASRLIGAPSIIGSSVVQQTVGTLQAGAVYDWIATVSTSAGQILTTNAHQACLAIV